jgi:EmrB/QacA subfamily drug resistance transporter
MQDATRKSGPWAILAVLCVGSFTILMDTTIVNVAIPSLIDTLHSGLDGVLWITNSYLLVFGALLITMSRIGDKFGPRRLFVLGLVVFALASLMCGLSQNTAELITARALTGVGAAMLAPQPLVIISATFPAERRGTALGLYTSMIGAAAVVGPTLGGVLVTYVGWRWIFFVNPPIALLAIILVYRIVPDLRLGRIHRLDLGGVVLATLALLFIVFGLIEGERYSWSRIASLPITIPEVIAAGVVLLVVFAFWERRQSEPLLPLVLFKDRTITLMTLLSGAAQFGLTGVMILGALNLQSALGYSAVVSGLTGLPLTLSLATVAPFAGRLSDRIGSRAILAIGFLVNAAGLALLYLVVSVHATPWTFVVPYMLIGLGVGSGFAPLTTEALNRATPQLTGALAGTLNTSRQLGSAIGSAVIGAVLADRLATNMQAGAVSAAAGLPAAVRPKFVAGFANIAQSGLDVGRGQSGGVKPPAGLSAPVAAHIQSLTHGIFTESYVHAMRYCVVILVLLLLVCAASCVVLMKSRQRGSEPTGTPAAVPGQAEVASGTV